MGVRVFVTNGILELCGMAPRSLILNNIQWPSSTNNHLGALVNCANQTLANPDPQAILAHQTGTRTKIMFTVPSVAREALIADRSTNMLILCCAVEDSSTAS